MDKEKVKGCFGCVGCLSIIIIAGILIRFPMLITGGIGILLILFILLPIPFIPVYLFAQYVIKKIDELQFSRLKVITFLSIVLLLIVTLFYGLFLNTLLSFAYLKYFITFFLIYYIRSLFITLESIKSRILIQENVSEFIKKSYILMLTSIFALFFYLSISFFLNNDARWWVNSFIWIATMGMQLYLIYRIGLVIKVANNFFLKLDKLLKEGEFPIAINSYKKLIKEQENLSEDDAMLIYELIESIYLKYLEDKKLHEVHLGEEIYLYQISAYIDKQKQLKHTLSKKVKYTTEELSSIIDSILHINVEYSQIYVKTQVDFGEIYEFEDGDNFSPYTYRSKIKICSSCGFTELSDDEINDSEWFCSDICKNTDEICKKIIKTPMEKFLADAVEKSFILIAGGNAWNNNQRLFGIGGQGHGYAAENANNMIDILEGKDATVIGGDNAKNGADRIVNGKFIQTKYCSSANSTVGQAFEAADKGGMYRYIDKQGKPMLLEVPKDQYDDALKQMAKKIKNGKVPGVKDPSKAKDIIHKGHITYQQAKNIVKFGTFESLTYDITEGSITAATTGGISFFITSFIVYIKTKDKKQALQAGSIQAGKAFAKTLTVYVSSQQLHRIEFIQKTLNIIDLKELSPSLQKFFQKGLNTSNISEANKALKGQVVTSAVIILVSESVDFYKFINGYMSSTEFLRNAINTTAGVGGGFGGAIVGQAIIPIPVVGGIIGGTIGGIVASKASDMIGEHIFGERDKEKIVPLIKKQFSYLCFHFALSHEEIENFNLNMSNILNDKIYEMIFASNKKKAVINSYLCPIVICIVKQRPKFEYKEEDILDSFEE